MTFTDLALRPELQRAVRELGYDQPTPIQQQAIPPVLAGHDIFGCAQTGTGKTAAFALPILNRIAEGFRKGPRALILAPTRELAVQISESFRDYAKYTRMRYVVAFGGVSQRPQVEAIRRGVDIVIATPGRLIDLLDQRVLFLDRIETLVLDEADRMLDMGFIQPIRRIVKELPENRQTLFFSATMPIEIRDLAATILRDPIHVSVTPESTTTETVEQRLMFVEHGMKPQL
ncbi:MAG: DEAD/DEAH box helicase, partial [Candidatus Kapabacteria bacterium]|nr:DEAD/DEAH box helicase [Candidatus Kapabacteria bacterium]